MKNLIKTQSNSAKFIVAAGFLSLGCMAIGATAQALEPTVASTTNQSVTYRVGFADLDVSKLKGAKTLYLRIRYAAETLCESAATWGKKEGDACVQKAVNDAVARIDASLLTEYSQQHSRGGKAALAQLAKAN
jgi:UrcA family protein